MSEFLALVAALLALFAGEQATDTARTCEAPCTVTFPAGMQEDMYAADYRRGELAVSLVTP